ncbi:MAG: tetraacyldisaccharide 4'-kinase, partial [Acidobacteriota bacterium]|nr:tetraacyldisaccharide 4'-kinase [Acidobacteriota bacterium]
MKRKAIFLLYRVLQALASPAICVYLASRVIRNRRYLPSLRERFGVLPALWQRTAPGAIWLHAVSVGEVLAAIPLLDAIRKSAPAVPVYVSTTTLAGRAAADKRIGAHVFYAPLDFVWVIRRVLRRLRPSLVIVMETEIWPNLFREVNRLGCGLVMVNGRISDRALPTYVRFDSVFREVLRLCDRIVAQSEEMRRRFVRAGAPAAIVEVGGNLKYDFTASPAAFEWDDPRPLWIAASTSADDRIEEEDFVIAAQRQMPGWRLVIAPRKPERFDVVAAKLDRAGLSWSRRTQHSNALTDVLLLDTIGELSGLFAQASVVFMGGTLSDKGGHNILEPALFGKPVIAGPHMENFQDIADHFDKQQALLRIATGLELGDAVMRADSDPGLGPRALAAARIHTGAARRTADAAMAVYAAKYPSCRPAQPRWMFLWFYAQIWRYASARDRRRKQARARKLPVPVVSVGNITAGGTGKTPVTIELLRDFKAARPGLLTRGHGRSTHEIVVLPAGSEHIPVSLTGDEAQLYLRALAIPIGIGGERYDAGMRLLPAAKLLFLDDGFQHLQLERDFDLVLVDALNPLGGGHLLPLGRLREPLDGLARAHAFLITRSDEVADTRAIEAVLRRYNPAAPIFHARTVARGWSGDEGAAEPGDAPSLAFCGLGNPQSFWNTLE